jgi:hypothetical protein
MRLEVDGTLRTDGGTVYVNGMDLSNLIEAAIPGLEDLKYPGCRDYSGTFWLTITKAEDDPDVPQRWRSNMSQSEQERLSQALTTAWVEHEAIREKLCKVIGAKFVPQGSGSSCPPVEEEA